MWPIDGVVALCGGGVCLFLPMMWGLVFWWFTRGGDEVSLGVGVLLGFHGWRRDLGVILGRRCHGFGILCCLTISSEEKETWTAGSLRVLAASLRSGLLRLRQDFDGHVRIKTIGSAAP